MRFINREKELAALEQEYLRSGSAFVVIYGRRRVGKTTLIQEFIKDKPALYFLADKQGEHIQLDRFREITAETWKDEIMQSIRFDSWDGIFKYIAGNNRAKNKRVIVIDEFQYLVKVNEAVPSIFQRIWDELLKNTDIMLILCGSIISMMYRSALNYSSPLYGRRTSQLKVAPLRFAEMAKFFPAKTTVEQIELFAVLSGIPKYIELFKEGGDIFSSIAGNILDKDSFFYHEPMYILNEELTETATYFSLLEVISKGEHKIGKIAERLQIPTNNLTSFLNRLIELELLEREVPVTEKNPLKSKRGLYFIKDHFFRFWFRYVLPYRSYLEIGNSGVVLDKIKLDFNLFTAQVFEAVCRDYILRLSAVPGQFPMEIQHIGRWWDNREEIDIVAFSDKEMLLGECKWWEAAVGINILENLKKKAVLIDKGDREIYFALFAKSGFTPELEQLAKKEKNILLYDFRRV